MCKRTQLIGIILVSLGLGLVLSCLFLSPVFRVILGILVIASGGILFKQSC